MATTSRGRTATAPEDELRRMVGPDPVRYGAERGRLLTESIPVWAIIGYIAAISGATEPSQITDSVIAQVAADYDISERAVLAALLYYAEHRGAIDSFLEANAAATRI